MNISSVCVCVCHWHCCSSRSVEGQ